MDEQELQEQLTRAAQKANWEQVKVVYEAEIKALMAEVERKALVKHTNVLRDMARSYYSQYPDANFYDFIGLIAGLQDFSQVDPKSAGHS